LEALAVDNMGAKSLSDPVGIKVVEVPPLPVVIIEATDPLASEPNPITPAIDSARFRVSRHGDLSRPLTVFYGISGTASNGVDYQSLSGVVTIPSNSPSAIIEVIPLHDTLVEGTESVILALRQPPCVLSNAVTPDCYLVGNPDATSRTSATMIAPTGLPRWPSSARLTARCSARRWTCGW
jgi:hypothetical protein